MKEPGKDLPQPRLVTMGEEMLEILRPTDWGDVSPDVSNLTTTPAVGDEEPQADAGYTVSQHVSPTGVTFAFTETVTDSSEPLELPIDTGNRNHSAKSLRDTARFLLENQ